MHIAGFKGAYNAQKAKTDVALLGQFAQVLLTEQALLDLGYVVRPTRLGLYAFTSDSWDTFQTALASWKSKWANLTDAAEPKPSFVDYGFNIANVE